MLQIRHSPRRETHTDRDPAGADGVAPARPRPGTTRSLLAPGGTTARSGSRAPWRRRVSVPGALAIAAIGIAGVVFGQSLLIDRGIGAVSFGLYLVGVLAICGFCWPTLATRVAATTGSRIRMPDRSAPLWVAGAGLVASLIAYSRAETRNASQHSGDVAIFWTIGMTLMLVAAAWHHPGPRFGRLRATIARPAIWLPTAGGAGIVAIAACARLLSLDRFTTILDSDEGYYLVLARAARDGGLPNPFSNSFPLVPITLWVSLEGWISRPFADDIASYRILSAVCGTLGVLGTWLIGRRLFGEAIGLSGAAVLALMPLNLWASRSALNNILDPMILAFALLLADRAVRGRRRLDATVCGIVMGFGYYGYWGARVFPLVIGAFLAVSILLPHTRLRWSEAFRLGGWIVAGFVTAAAPVLGYFTSHPAQFMRRIDTVTNTAHQSLLDRIGAVPKALLYPLLDQVSGFHGGFYRQGPPFLGWALAPFVAIGGAVWIVWLVRGLVERGTIAARPEPMLIAWVMIAGGISQTGDMQSQRFLSITIVWALAAGTGIVVIVRALAHLGRWPFWGLPLVTALVIVGIGLSHTLLYFSESQQIVAYGDRRTTAAYDIGWRIRQLPSYPTILLAGTEYLSYAGFGNWQYLDPGLNPKITVLPAFANIPQDIPVIPPGELLVIAGERPDAQRCAIAAKNPSAHIAEARNRQDTLLYTIFSTGSDLILPTTESPGETRLLPIPALSCGPVG